MIKLIEVIIKFNRT